jgi:6-phosphogluconate dehydrogenase
MQLGMIGLGRMGANMTRRLRRGGIDVVGYNREHDVATALAAESGMRSAETLEGVVAALAPPRILWIMLPAGAVTESHVDRIAALLEAGDLVVDGANSNYKDSMRRGAACAERGLAFVDAGVSGGIWGLEEGYALMLGGDAAAVARLKPALEALAPAPDRGWLHCGPVGSGHYVKMVHNGIEYGLMQSYAEGLALLEAREDFALDLAAVTETWRHGSVVRSWLLDLTAAFLARDPTLDGVAPFVADSGEGRWTAIEAIEQGVPTPVMSTALMARFASQGNGDYAAKVLAMMRASFGGHALKGTDGA